MCKKAFPILSNFSVFLYACHFLVCSEAGSDSSKNFWSNKSDHRENSISFTMRILDKNKQGSRLKNV